MESPESWDALTASLAVCDLNRAHSAWAFAALQGLVRDDPGDRDVFLRRLEEEKARGEITGPSLPCRVAGALSLAGITRPSGMLPDPWGKISGTRLEAVASWGALGNAQLESLRQLQQHFDHQRSTAKVDAR
jgi:hypothetical protein